jgi:Zn finger protein HypA/HybF involved in hydrogenase expression
MQRGYAEDMQPKGGKCPHCSEHIMILVGKKKDQCPVCGKVLKIVEGRLTKRAPDKN